MHITQSLLLFALSISTVYAAANTTTSQTHIVRVGQVNNSTALRYFPDNISAKVGDTIQFQFAAGNHTVTQSTFDAPCVPISQSSNNTGVFSGFMNVAAGLNSTGMVPVFSMPVKVATPLWFYCSQGKHCQNGMVLVVNENTAANSTRSLANFAALAAKATKNIAPTSNGTSSTSSSTSSTSNSGSSGSTGSSSGSSGSSSTATTLSPASGTSSSNSGDSSAAAAASGTATTSTSLAAATANAGNKFGVQNAMGYVGALGAGVMVLL
ncbi:putative extracellular serine-rich protein [Botrytis fragariae]|uniref:Putative extracellular serine-rich protein n=1 Tax=Botrytis fragariae TaxID=1964551 RepID=A0A8H6B451_9HELO|nr:putative extracellular serine-rich protein [Botrytis fragariae]KAF5879101.1 putative extracellular serine-rich protein [Botrytis fragariae]